MTYKHDFRPGLYCIELRTAAWPAMLMWYRETLGLKVLVRIPEDGYALLEAGETRLVLLARPNAGPASDRWSLGFEVDRLDQTVARPRAAGCEVSLPRLDPEGFREARTTDPDGNRIRLFSWPEAE